MAIKIEKMNLQTKKLLRIIVTTSSKEQILEEIRKYLDTRYKIQDTRYKKKIKPFIIFTPNPEIISYAQNDDNFTRIVNTAQINLPDGVGIVWAIKKLYKIKIERIAGIDFMENLVDLAERERFTIGLIGGREDLADVTAECLLAKYPKLKVEVFEGPEVEFGIRNKEFGIRNKKIHNSKSQKTLDTKKYFEFLAKDLREKKIDILFVALGHPKQEYFIDILNSYFLIHNSRPIVLMAVGGAFDYISGRVGRAPLVIRNIGLEWLFRLLREPWRLSRQLSGAKFFIDILTSV